MKKILALILVSVMMFSAVSVFASAEESSVTFVFSEMGYENAQIVEQIEKEGVTMTLSLGTNDKDNYPAYYDKGGALRIYKNNSFTLSSDKDIISVSFTFVSEYEAQYVPDVGECALDGQTCTWTGRAAGISFENPDHATRVTEMTVVITDEEEPAEEPAVLPGYVFTAEMLSSVTMQNLCEYERYESEETSYVRFTATGDDPFVVFGSEDYIDTSYCYAAVVYRTKSMEIQSIDIYPRIAEPHACTEDVTADGEWHTAVINLNDAGYNWDGYLKRLDPMSGYGLEGSYIDIAYIALFDDRAAAYQYNGGVETGEIQEREQLDYNKLNIVVDGALYNHCGIRNETVEVRVRLRNYGYQSICSLRAVLQWPEELELLEVRYDIAWTGSSIVNEFEYPQTSPFVLNWIDLDGERWDECFVTLLFRVDKKAKSGTFLPITLDVDPADVFTEVDEYVDFKVLNGGVKVESRNFPGDVDWSCSVNNRDVVTLFRVVNGIISEDEIDVEAADVFEDGELNNKDVVRLFRMSSSRYRF